MTILFWLSAFLIAYVYLGYPAMLGVWARLRRMRRHVAAHERDGRWPERIARDRLPGVSIVVAARNEAARLPARIANLLALDYPADRRQIIVVSDGSTDGTDQALARYGSSIEVVSIPQSGKALALNAGVERAVHDILVFADARQRFACGALRALVAPFADARIGGVSGELVLDAELSRPDAGGDSPVRSGVGAYWRFEKWLRRRESEVGSLVGATGAIYALRRSLWRPLPAETILDDVLAPMRAVLAGYRVVFTDRAQAFDYAASTSQAESRRKVRTLAGNVQLLWLEPRLLVPFVNPVWLQFCSHKLGRLAVPYALVALMAGSIALAPQHPIYALALGAQCAFYLLAGYGACLELRSEERARRAVGQPMAAAMSWRSEPRKGVVNA